MTERSEDMGDGGVLEMVSDVEWTMVELVDCDYPENRDGRRNHDGRQGKVGKHLGLARLQSQSRHLLLVHMTYVPRRFRDLDVCSLEPSFC